MSSMMGRDLRLSLVLLLLVPAPALALDPARSISQYGHMTWTLRDGFLPGAPTDMTQTADGYLWIGTRAGVVRFDGVRFTPLTPPEGQQLPTNRIMSIGSARDGSLWIGTRGGLARWHKGHLTQYADTPGSVMSILEDHSGKVWFTRLAPPNDSATMCEVSGERATCHGAADGVPMLRNLAADAQGRFWAVSDNVLVRWDGASARTWVPPGLPPPDQRTNLDVFQSVLPDPDGSVWVGAMQPSRGLGLLRLVGDELQPFVVPGFDGRRISVSRMLFDRHGALWIGTQDEGVYRLHEGKVSHYRRGDGLTSDTVQNLFQDREGTLWVLTTQGIDAFRDLRVASVSSREGLTADLANAVLAGRDGTVWIDTWHSLDILRDGKVTSLRAGRELPGEEVSALFEDRDGTLWVGIDYDVTVYEHGRFKPIRRADGHPLGFVQQLTQDTAGDIWVVTSDPASLWRIRDRKVVEEIPRTTVPFTYGAIDADPQEGIWLPLKNGELGRYRRGQLEKISFGREPGTGQIIGLVAMPDGSVVGSTSLGLVGWRDGKAQTMTTANGLPCNDVHTLLSTPAGELWLYSLCGVVFVASDQVRAWWNDPAAHLTFRVFDALDGAQPARGNFFPRASRGADGRLWFANASVVQMVDPAHLSANALTPPVHIEQVVADRNSLAPVPGLRLPSRTRDVQIDYTALSLVVPRKTVFRYRLEGH